MLSACPKIRVDYLHSVTDKVIETDLSIENVFLTELPAVSPDPMKLLKQMKYVGTNFNVCK